MKAIKNMEHAANPQPKTVGHVDGAITSSVNVRKHRNVTAPMVAARKRAEARKTERMRGPITGGVSISAKTMAATESLARIAMLVAGAAPKPSAPLVAPLDAAA